MLWRTAENGPRGWKRRSRTSIRRVLTLGALIVLSGGAGAVAAVEIWPSLGAQAAHLLRERFGPRLVADLESVVFQAQDAARQWLYRSGRRQATAPWDESASHAAPAAFAATSIPAAPLTRSPEPGGRPPPPPQAAVWEPAPLQALGALEGEGIWEPYLYDRDGHPVAARTFLQPDPARPYAVVAVVAFDLRRTRLHFVLGYRDPGLGDGPRGEGLIPAEDLESGRLLAAFNGGFRTANGMYGAMADGILALPPRADVATVGIYRSGEVRIGLWGEAILDTSDLLAWRQNCAPVVQGGEITAEVYNESIADWGGSVSSHIVTWRSGMGLDREAGTLYYFAGPSLSMPALADAMLAAGVHDGMLLDINGFWVLFTAIHSEGEELVAEPLLPRHMIDKIDRYLQPSPVDFFYVTLQEGDDA